MLKRTIVNVYICPSDTRPAISSRAGYAKSNYVGVYGRTNSYPTFRPGNGILGPQVSIKFRDITDGTSNTFIVGERGGTIGSYTRSSIWAGMHQGGGQAAVVYGTGMTPIMRPNSTAGGFQAFSSLHTGGLHMLLADGSARFVSENISGVTWSALGSRNGGEVLDGF